MVDKQKIFFLAIGIAFLIGWYSWFKNKRVNLQQSHKLTNGTVVGCNWGGKGNAVFYVDYVFILSGKRYKGSASLGCNSFQTSTLENKLIGKVFPIVYYPTNPDQNTILMDWKNFNSYNEPVPDTLINVINYLSTCE